MNVTYLAKEVKDMWKTNEKTSSKLQLKHQPPYKFRKGLMDNESTVWSLPWFNLRSWTTSRHRPFFHPHATLTCRWPWRSWKKHLEVTCFLWEKPALVKGILFQQFVETSWKRRICLPLHRFIKTLAKSERFTRTALLQRSSQTKGTPQRSTSVWDNWHDSVPSSLDLQMNDWNEKNARN